MVRMLNATSSSSSSSKYCVWNEATKVAGNGPSSSWKADDIMFVVVNVGFGIGLLIAVGAQMRKLMKPSTHCMYKGLIFVTMVLGYSTAVLLPFDIAYAQCVYMYI